MVISIKLNGALMTGLENQAKHRQISVEELALRILTESINNAEDFTLEDVVAKIRAKGPNPSQIVPPLKSLSEVLATPGNPDPIDPEQWNQMWATVEADLKASAIGKNASNSFGNPS
ncbi:hypothetical protein BH10PLA2_BH10PLA2_33650 [soil metagenome]